MRRSCGAAESCVELEADEEAAGSASSARREMAEGVCRIRSDGEADRNDNQLFAPIPQHSLSSGEEKEREKIR